MKTMKLTNNITTKTRRPLATGPRLALTLALALAPLGLTALGAVTVAPGVASAASCSPATFQPIGSWVWTGYALYVVPAGTSGSSAVQIPMPTGVTFPTAWMNQQVDNPAPLEWLYANGPKYGLPDSNLANVFSACQTYTPQLITRMNVEGFAPSMIGGVNPPGITTSGTTATTQPTQSTPPTQTTKTGTTTQTTPTQPTSTSTATIAPAPKYPPVVTTVPTSGATIAGHSEEIQQIMRHDQQIVADGPGKTPPPQKGSPILPIVVVGVLLLSGAGAVVVRRRNRGMTTDEANRKLGGRRNF